ncbi:MAG: GNAT family N-acetyltransferase [Acidimicrobiales bacterium]
MDAIEDVRLRPIEEGDLDQLRQIAVDPEAGGEFEWTGFQDPHEARRRWEKDGWLNAEQSLLAVIRADGAFAGIVSWRDRSLGTIKGVTYEFGIALWPEHRGHGVGTRAQQLLVDYLFRNTPVHRLQAFTETGNLAEQRALEKLGFQREGVLRELFFRAGAWRDSVLYARLRSES